MSFTESQEEVLVICSFVFSLLSLLSSTAVIVYYLSFKELRKFAFGLVAWTAVADSIRCMGNLIGSPDEGKLCGAQGFLKTLGGVASLSWVGCMAYSIRQICSQKTINTGSLLRKFHLFTWTVSGISAILPFVYDLYKPVGGWCWISKYDEGVILRWTSFYGLLWLDVMWICIVYLSLWLSLKDLPLKERQPEVSKMVSRLYIYPLILIVCYGPASVRRIWDIFENPPYWLAIVHICFSSLHGLVNAIAYGKNADVQVTNAKIMESICGSCRDLRKFKSYGSQEGVAISFWSRKEGVSTSKGYFSDKEELSGSLPALRISHGVRRSRVVSGATTATPGSSFLDSQSGNVEMTSTREASPAHSREGEEKPEHDEKSKENTVADALSKWTL